MRMEPQKVLTYGRAGVDAITEGRTLWILGSENTLCKHRRITYKGPTTVYFMKFGEQHFKKNAFSV